MRRSNRSSRLTLPLGQSNSYFFSTAIHGIRRRSAASASREWVKAFSFTRSCCRAASHSCCDTIGGVFIAICPFGCSLSLSLLVAVCAVIVFFSLHRIFVLRFALDMTGCRAVTSVYILMRISRSGNRDASARPLDPLCGGRNSPLHSRSCTGKEGKFLQPRSVN